MVVCKFFQQGCCRYGQNCRFEHIYGSKYTYHANAPPQQSAQIPPPTTSGVTDEQLVKQVQSDVQAALQGNQWILSCYSPFKEKPIFPGIADLSFEETRLFIYEAKANNTVEQAVAHINNLFKETRQKYEQLLQPNMNIIKVLRSLYSGETVPSPFTSFDTAQNTFAGSDNAASSVFRSAIQSAPSPNNATPSIFTQQNNNVFNSQPSSAQSLFSNANNAFSQIQNQAATSIFATQNQQSAQSIFASAVQDNSVFNNNNQNIPSGLFSAANQNIFGKEPSQGSSPFGQNNSPFQQGSAGTPFSQVNNNNSPFGQVNIFQTSNTQSSIFGVPNSSSSVADDPGIYSKMEDITEVDLEAFKSNSFELGFIPEIPPPHELCVGGKGPF